METKDLIAPCGLYCGSCYFYLDKECPGCKPLNEGRKKRRERQCKLYICCREKKKFKFCGECPRLPCKLSYKVLDVIKRHLDKIKCGEKLRED
ncbi:MAG: DUF3795 domain-containing protein [Candidatus Thermoplasmatota archaeon]